jgi:hypothetical protein
MFSLADNEIGPDFAKVGQYQEKYLAGTEEFRRWQRCGRVFE